MWSSQFSDATCVQDTYSLRNLQTDLEDAEGEGDDGIELDHVMADKDDGISCELGIRYPMLQAIMSGDKNHQTLQVA